MVLMTVFLGGRDFEYLVISAIVYKQQAAIRSHGDAARERLTYRPIGFEGQSAGHCVRRGRDSQQSSAGAHYVQFGSIGRNGQRLTVRG